MSVSSDNEQPPVVFLVFNRPGPTARVFARIREAKPPVLFVISDGPRPNHPTDAGRVAEVRALIENGIDWPCAVHLEFSDVNLGCRERVRSGLDMVFKTVESAIILEDDCLPDPSFFNFCREMLTRYRDDESVAHISGTNFAVGGVRSSNRYRFSHQPWIWGWATWRRSWEKYDFHMSTWENRLSTLQSSFASAWEAQCWIPLFREAREDLLKANTWGFPWMYSCRSRKGLCIMPGVNLVENLGIGADSTHTKEDALFLNLKAGTMEFPLVHPSSRVVNRFADEKFSRFYFRKLTPKDAAISRLRIIRESFHQRFGSCQPSAR